MVSERAGWSLRGPLRALVWWPLVAFVLLAVHPAAGPVVVAGAGGALAVLGALASSVSRRPAARRATAEPDPVSPSATDAAPGENRDA
ncbi:hypothetical protein [Pseudonocardia asaccharolytica]|uniref:Uncharacterized protein n=1 Tax=Pseudonocardia asaccharolytica DSM 44247 = NBRC 16224 TaxID=1123024 RepID=A0A511D2E1_9PSEU|nr:hypothetical protein [Pseudonocardia asaccharolytica]GEL17734.1 hypothetical protein PA7_15710 [Pseudonocardia asaccharolytica DSM 44247 = NBRC 16224]